jgi:hypothetical protein
MQGIKTVFFPEHNPMSQIIEKYKLHPLSSEEQHTCQSLIADIPEANITLMPTHHMDAFGNLSGFHFRCPKASPATALPISRTMFFGHTMVECQEPESAILQLMLDRKSNHKKMSAFLDKIETMCVPAVLDYGPENTGYMNTYSQREVLTKDSGHWTPHVPDQIGIYHAMVRGYNREVREHRMYIICSGGLEKAADEFCNFVIDVGKNCDAYTVAMSDEAWWLRRASKRARCDLIFQLAKEFGLHIQSRFDIQSKNDRFIADSFLDSLDHDIQYVRESEEVFVFNGCCDTRYSAQGALVRMHPAEGFWLFPTGEYNGRLNRAGFFPSFQPALKQKQNTIPVKHGSKKIVCQDQKKQKDDTDIATSLYMRFDESYFQTLQATGWDRNQNFMELIPIIVGRKTEKT